MKDDDVLHADEATTAALAAAGVRCVRDVLARSECVRDLKDRSNHVLRAGPAVYHVKLSKRAKVSREAVAIEFLQGIGVPTASLAFWSALRGVGALCGTVDLAPARPMDDLLREGALSPAAIDGAFKALAEAAAAMHEARVHHRDLYLNHVFVDPTGARPGVTIIDVERLQRHVGVLPRAIVKDLAAVEASIPEGTVDLTYRARLVVHYLRARRFPVRMLLGNLLRRVSKKVEEIRAHVPRTPVGAAARPSPVHSRGMSRDRG
ncbi:MAG: lipopolysaccharide kinase InaA family protein [Planctomycetota bacterium]